MAKRFFKYLKHYYTKDSEIDVKLFKILGSAGVLVSIIGAVQSFMINLSGGFINLLAAALSILLLWFVDKTGKYTFAYIITTIGVFMGLFTMLFFNMGGMDGSMTFFFSFSLVFTFMMFKGSLLILMEFLEVFFYTGVCMYSVNHPEMVVQFESSEARFADQLVGILVSGVGIGLIFLVYIAEYRKQQKIAEEASKAKSKFLANMSHEIRTPINMMLGMNEMILRESDNEVIKEYATNAEDAGRQLLFEINQLLSFSRLEAGKESLIEESYSLSKLINTLKVYFEKEASKKNVAFIVDMDKDVEKVLVGNMRKLSQILTNLCSNAVKYTKEGSIVLKIKSLSKENGTETLRFSVEDTGIGIKKEELSNIFKSFERADLSKNRSIEGTGLGLSISGNLAKLLGTEIKVESIYSKGSTFSFVLTQKIGDSSIEEKDLNVPKAFVAPDAKILVVDDNAMNLNVAKSLLKKTLINVDTAGDARDCFNKCENDEYDLVLMDLFMPEIDGLEAMKHLRTMDGYKEKPIIVLTADVSPGKREELITEGFDGYLSKPVDWKELESTLLEKLPERMIISTTAKAHENLSEEEQKKFENLLLKADIELSDGIKYMGGDIFQYEKVASFFTKEADANIEKCKKAFLEKNEEDLTLLLHSLKGNAKNVGALELYTMAKRLEKRSRDKDFEFVYACEKLLFLEWERVKEGLLTFLKEFDKLKKPEGLEKKESKKSKEELLKELFLSLSEGKQTSSIKLLEELSLLEKDTKKLEALSKAEEQISNIEFEEAEELLKGIY